MDAGSTSVISDPKAGVSMVLNHLTSQVVTVPLKPPSAPGVPGAPAVPGLSLPGAPGAPPMPGVGAPAAPALPAGQNLGRSIINGEEVQGMRYALGAHTMEAFTSTKTGLPVLTTMTGPFGQQTCQCKTTPGEPDPALFQIPAGYTKL